MRVSDDYLAQLKELHEGPGWGKGGLQHLDEILELLVDTRATTVLDYGCGKGRLVRALNMRHIYTDGYDPAVEQFAHEPTIADLLVSTDVLEHIEPECLDEVLAHMAYLTGIRAYLVISLRPAVKHLPDGRNAHLIIESKEFWLSKLAEHFGLVRDWRVVGGGAGTLIAVC